MPRRCSICDHPQRQTIDQRLAESAPWAELVSVFTVSDSSLRRHKEKHLPRAMVLATDAVELTNADTLVTKVNALEVDAHRIGADAEKAGDVITALASVCQLVKIVELEARLLGELSSARVQVNMLNVQAQADATR